MTWLIGGPRTMQPCWHGRNANFCTSRPGLVAAGARGGPQADESHATSGRVQATNDAHVNSVRAKLAC